MVRMGSREMGGHGQFAQLVTVVSFRMQNMRLCRDGIQSLVTPGFAIIVIEYAIVDSFGHDVGYMYVGGRDLGLLLSAVDIYNVGLHRVFTQRNVVLNFVIQKMWLTHPPFD